MSTIEIYCRKKLLPSTVRQRCPSSLHVGLERQKRGGRTMSNWPRIRRVLWGALAALTVAFSSTSCTMVGPDYVRPPSPIPNDGMETKDPAVKREPAEVSAWWTVFNDPVLNTLVETAYRQNPSLRTAGVRVLEAQARRG